VRIGTILSRLRVGASTYLELIRGLWRGRFWWLIPLALFFLPLAVMFIVMQLFPVVAPFVYTLF
jgi:hypothetical protein